MSLSISGSIFDRANAADFGIVGFTKKTFTYVASGIASDDLISTITYLAPDGSTIGVLTLAYIGSTNNILSLERTT